MIFQLSQKCAQRVSRNAVLPDRLLPENLVPDAEFLIFEDLPDRGVLVRELLRLSLFETEHVILAGDRRRGFQPESRYETSESELQVAVVPQPYRHLIAALDRKRTFTLPFHFFRQLQNARVRERLDVAGDLHRSDLIENPRFRASDLYFAVSLNII